MRIDSVERLFRLQDSLASFGDPSLYAWYLIFRGRYASSARRVFQRLQARGIDVTVFGDELTNEWRVDSLRLLRRVREPYVLVWLEDHINLAGPAVLHAVAQEIHESSVDVCSYTWFHRGETFASFTDLPHRETAHLLTLDYDANLHTKRLSKISSRGLNAQKYIFGLPSIVTTRFFLRVLRARPAVDVPEYSPDSPFDIEQSDRETHWLPVRMAVPKLELFAPVDDDHGQSGYSLISRGMYPQRGELRSSPPKRDGFENYLFRAVKRAIAEHRKPKKEERLSN